MVKILDTKTFDFKDLLLKPRCCVVKSRKDIVLDGYISAIQTWAGTSYLSLYTPVVSANMDTITGPTMVKALDAWGSTGFLHRYKNSEEIVKDIKYLQEQNTKVIVPTIGIQTNDINNASKYFEAGASAVCIDIAHAHSLSCIQFVKELKKLFPTNHIIVGNIATADAARDLIEAGATGLKVGIGGGAVCSTRTETGAGSPQAYAIAEVAEYIHQLPFPVGLIADGGIREVSDIVKAFGLGATAVMCGSFFAGCPESEAVVNGLTLTTGDRTMVEFRGMASKRAQEGFKGFSKNIEGICTYVKVQPPVDEIMTKISDGLKSGISYAGFKTLQQFIGNATFLRTGA